MSNRHVCVLDIKRFDHLAIEPARAPKGAFVLPPRAFDKFFRAETVLWQGRPSNDYHSPSLTSPEHSQPEPIHGNEATSIEGSYRMEGVDHFVSAKSGTHKGQDRHGSPNLSPPRVSAEKRNARRQAVGFVLRPPTPTVSHGCNPRRGASQ